MTPYISFLTLQAPRYYLCKEAISTFRGKFLLSAEGYTPTREGVAASMSLVLGTNGVVDV